MILTEQSDADDVLVSARYLRNEAKRVVLWCVKSAALYADSLESDPLLFSWREVHSDLTTSLVSEATTEEVQIQVYGIRKSFDGTFYLGDSFFEEGATAKVGDGDIREIVSINEATGVLTLDGEVGGSANHPQGTTVTITPKDSRLYSDSLSGVCKLTSSETFQTTSANLYVDSTRSLSPGMILFARNVVCKVTRISSETTVTVEESVLSSHSGSGDGVTLEAGTVLRGAIWVEFPGRGYPVGGTGVTISVTSPDLDSSFLGRFVEGDRIIVDSKGLALKRIESAVYRESIEESIRLYGRKDWKGKINPFLYRKRIRAILDQYSMLSYPYWVTTTKGPLALSIDPGDRFSVYCADIWPDESSGVNHHVTKIVLDLARKQTLLVLRSSQVPRRGGDLGGTTEDLPAWGAYGVYG